MHLSSANAKQWSRLNISQKMLENDEKMYFKNIVSNAINEDLKNMFARLYDIFCFQGLHKFNSVCVIFHYLVSQLFK